MLGSVSCHNRWVSTELVTDRLRLRQWVQSDLDPLIEIFSKPEMWHYPLRRGFTPEQTTNFLARQIAAQDLHEIALLAAEDRFTHQLLGYIGLGEPNSIKPEGAMAVLNHAFEELDLDELVSIFQPENIASGMVMIHLGMHFDRDTIDPARDIPLRVYRLSQSQWIENSIGSVDG